MIALVLSLCVFAFLALVGSAVLALLAADEEPLYRLLLAPVTGAAATMIPLYLVSQLGLPVGRFGLGMAIGYAIASVSLLWWRGKRIPRKDFLPFVLLALFAFLMVGWPMLRFGFDWVSFSNDDMANYCMGAERLLHFGYYQPPNAAALAGADYTQMTWFLHVLHRPGSELFMAMVQAVTGLGSLRIFMPVIVAFLACQISGAAAMTWAAGRSRLAVWLVWLLMAVSALVTLGTLYQLIAQVIGLGIAAGVVAVLLQPLQEVPAPNRLRRGALIGLLLAGLLVAYTEVLPFVALGYVLYVLVTLRGDWAAWRRALPVLAIGAAVAIVLLNRLLPLATIYVLRQAASTAPENPATTMFPYYMLPAGPVYFWGLFAIGRLLPSDAIMSLWIILALGLCAGAAALVGRSFLRRQGPAFVCAIMGAVWAVLFVKHAGFGMYKLAMYFQPFILSALVLGWMSLWRSRVVQVAPLLLIAAANLPSQHFYMRMSLGLDRVFTEIPAASSSHVVREYADLLKAHPGSPLELDTFNSTLAKFQMIESVGRPALFPSNDFLTMIDRSRIYAPLVGRSSAEAGMTMAQELETEYPATAFNMRPPPGSTEPAENGFWLVRQGQSAVEAADAPGHLTLFVACTGRQGVFNRWSDPEESPGNFRAGPLASFADHLIFVASDLGQPYFRPGAPRVSIFQLEPDLVYTTHTMAAAGRYLLFRVVNPSARVRLKLDITDTFAGDGENRLPPAEAIGAARVSFPLAGRGSARVFSAPLTPQLVRGIPFVAIDMGTDGTHLDYAPGGLMRLWGRNIRLDRRKVVGFVRDISLIADDEYGRIDAPSMIEHFPDDLFRRTLEYAGIYEDGYMGDQGFVALGQPAGTTLLLVEGVIPKINDDAFAADVVLSVDGRELVRKRLPVGVFTLSANVPAAPAGHHRRKIGLAFDRLQHLPNSDARPVGAQLLRIGFVSGPASVTWSAGDPARLGVDYSGVWLDGWAGRDASVRLNQSAGATRLCIRGMVPRISDADFKTDVVVKVDGKQVAQKAVGPGEFEIAADLPPGPADRKVELSFSKLQRLPAPDTRSVGALLKSVEFR